MLRYLPAALLSLAVLFLIVMRLSSGSPANTPAGQCSPAPSEPAAPVVPGAIELSAWAPNPNGTCGLINALVLAAGQIGDPPVHLTPHITEVLERFSAPMFAQAAAAHAAPDIGYAENQTFVELAQQGYLEPLDDCYARHTEFAGIDPDLQPYITAAGKIWGVPAGIDVGILYFNKEKLRALNWPAEMIDSLPERIRSGAWTLADMLNTVRQARSLSLIGEGEGFWPNYHRRHTFWLVYLAYGGRVYDVQQAKLVVNLAALVNTYQFHRTLVQEEMMPPTFAASDNLASWPGNAVWRDSEAHGQPLFWQASTSFWPNYIDAALEIGEAGLFTRIGLALFPSAKAGSPGHGWAHAFRWYVIASEQASGRQQQDAACTLLAKTLTPDIYAQSIRQSGQLGALESQTTHPASTADPFNARTSYMWEYAAALPTYHPASRTYENILAQFRARVERGELTPEVAAAAAILRLQNEVGDVILVE